VTIAVTATDPGGLVGSGVVTLVIIPPGVPRFGGFIASTLPYSFPTSGGSVIEMSAENLVMGAIITAVYRNDAMRAVNASYAAQVRERLWFGSCLVRDSECQSSLAFTMPSW